MATKFSFIVANYEEIKVSEVNFIGHPFILSLEKKNWNKSTYFGISKGVYLICVNSMLGSVIS